jgi:hypothetical protein
MQVVVAPYQDVHFNGDTIAIMQLVVVLYQDKYKMIQPFHLSAAAPTTATIRRTLSSTVPSLAPGYPTTTIDGELMLLFRLAYRVNIMYQVNTILSLIVLLLQPGSVQVVLHQDVHDDDDTIDNVHKEDNTIAITQLVVLYLVLYRVKYKMVRLFHDLRKNGETEVVHIYDRLHCNCNCNKESTSSTLSRCSFDTNVFVLVFFDCDTKQNS